MKCVCIVGPITSGDLLANIRQADAAYLALTQAGLYPFNPILAVYAGGAQYIERGSVVHATGSAASSLPLAYEDFMRTSLAWVAKSDAVLRLPGASKGAGRETALADSLAIPVFATVAEVVAWATNTSSPHGAD